MRRHVDVVIGWRNGRRVRRRRRRRWQAKEKSVKMFGNYLPPSATPTGSPTASHRPCLISCLYFCCYPCSCLCLAYCLWPCLSPCLYLCLIQCLILCLFLCLYSYLCPPLFIYSSLSAGDLGKVLAKFTMFLASGWRGACVACFHSMYVCA